MLKELNQIFRPVYKSWRLNQRMYGAMEGLSYDELAQAIGRDKVDEYRNSFYIRPPPMAENHPNHHRKERKYIELHTQNEIPLTESIADCFERTITLYKSMIYPDLVAGKTVLVVAHANSLRGLIKYVDNLNPEDVQKMLIPSKLQILLFI